MSTTGNKITLADLAQRHADLQKSVQDLAAIIQTGEQQRQAHLQDSLKNLNLMPQLLQTPGPEERKAEREQAAAERQAARDERKAERADFIEAARELVGQVKEIVKAQQPWEPSAEYLRELVNLARASDVVIVIGDIRIEPVK